VSTHDRRLLSKNILYYDLICRMTGFPRRAWDRRFGRYAGKLDREPAEFALVINDSAELFLKSSR